VVLTVGDKDEILSMEESSSPPAGKEAVASRPVTSRPVRRPAARDESAQGAYTPTAMEGTIRVERSDVEESLTNINKLMSQVRIRPHCRHGNPDGLALSRIGEESLFSKLGLQDGDIVQAVDDKKIQSPDDVLALYKKLRSGSEVAIQIDRQGRRQTLNYRFE
jgi:general secretion pathway protein C